VPGGFEMFATAINVGAGWQFRQRRDDDQERGAALCHARLFLEPCRRPDDLPGETFEYRVALMVEEQAFQFREGTASTRFSGFSTACP